MHCLSHLASYCLVLLHLVSSCQHLPSGSSSAMFGVNYFYSFLTLTEIIRYVIYFNLFFCNNVIMVQYCLLLHLNIIMEYCICLYCICMGAGGGLRGKGDACNQSCPCTRIAFPFLAWHAHVHSHALTLMHGARVWACTKLIVDASNRIRPCAIVLGVTPSCVGWIHPCMMDPGREGGGCPLNACVHSSCALSWMHRIGDA